MRISTRFGEKLGLRLPVIQAPMAGGPSTQELVAAVSAAGGLGSFGFAYTQPDEMQRQVAWVRAKTDRPLGINLFVADLPAAIDAGAQRGALEAVAGYYAEQRRRPDIAFYDTAGTAGGTIAAYDKAVADGADFVLGPLGRDAVSTLFRNGRLTVPVLALNRGNVPPPAGSASFSLAPEDDGIAAAEYLIARKAPRVLVFADGDDGMRRAVAAFREQLQARGGSIVAEIGVGAEPGDLSAAIATAARKEGGVDAVFLALKPAQARALAPQLSLAGLGGKLRVATSQLSGAGEDATRDHALDGIAFPTEVWSVRGVAGLPSATSAASLLPSARGGAAKLFAFGYDAWLLTAYLERLATGADGKVTGATGTLRIDGFGNVVRTPAWSTYSGATAVPLGNAGG